MSRAAKALSDLEDISSAKLTYKQILDWLKTDMKISEIETGVVLSCYGALLLKAREYSNAHLFIKRAMTIYERFYGWDNEATGHVVNNLGVCKFELGDATSALPLFEKAHEIYAKTSGKEHFTTLVSRPKLRELSFRLAKIALHWRFIKICLKTH